MLCYRCGSHVPETAERCGTCGQNLAGGGVRQATGTFSRKRLMGAVIEGAPYAAGDVIAQRYDVVDALGAGPFGFVFRVNDREAGGDVALKSINPRLLQTTEERAHFEQVLRSGQKLSHPNLCRVLSEGVDNDRPYFTLPYMEGLNLRKIIDLRLGKGQFFTLRETEPIIAQIATALDAAHKVGPHGDLRPDNVVVLPDLLKLTDFGFGLALPRVPFIQGLKARKADRYLAPELVAGSDVDGRADVYSLGVILGEMLAGVTPDGMLPELQQRNPDLPAALESLYRKTLNSNPMVRPASAGAFFQEFQAIVKEACPPPIEEPPRAAVPASTAVVPPVAPSLSASRAAADAALKVSVPPEIEQTEIVASLPPPPPQDVSGESAAAATPGSSARLKWKLAALAAFGLMVGAAAALLVAQGTRPAPVPPVNAAQLEAEAAAQEPVSPEPPQIELVEPNPPTAESAQPRPPSDSVPPVQAVPAKATTTTPPTNTAPPSTATAPPTASAGPSCSDGMRLISAGSFKMGTVADDAMRGFDERNLTAIQVKAFCMDVYEFPNKRGVVPRADVSWADARRLCEARGKRLCLETEWEKACKGPADARFPYGEQFDANACNTEDDAGDDRAVAPSGRFARCRSGYGVADLAGNIAEWTASPYATNNDKVQKGGAFNRPDYASRCSARKNGPPVSREVEVGFRCCADPT